MPRFVRPDLSRFSQLPTVVPCMMGPWTRSNSSWTVVGPRTRGGSSSWVTTCSNSWTNSPTCPWRGGSRNSRQARPWRRSPRRRTSPRRPASCGWPSTRSGSCRAAAGCPTTTGARMRSGSPTSSSTTAVPLATSRTGPRRNHDAPEGYPGVDLTPELGERLGQLQPFERSMPGAVRGELVGVNVSRGNRASLRLPNKRIVRESRIGRGTRHVCPAPPYERTWQAHLPNPGRPA